MTTVEVWITTRDLAYVTRGMRFSVHLAPPPKPHFFESSRTKKWMRNNWTKMLLDVNQFKVIQSDEVLGILHLAPLNE